MKDRPARLVFLFVITAMLAALPLYRIQVRLDDMRSRVAAQEALRYLPSGKFLSSAVLGYDNLAADFLWIRGIALFGEQFQLSKDSTWYLWLFQLIDLASDLDPLDVRIYKYGGLMLRLDSAHIDQSTYIFNKGIAHLPSEYYLPYGVAMNYFEYRNDAGRAADYMQKASTCPKAPFFLRNLAASLLDSSRRHENALQFLNDELRELEPDTLAYKAVRVKIDEVKHDAATFKLEAALNSYLSIYNRLPEPLEAMKGRSYFGAWPKDPLGGTFVLDHRSGRILSTRWEETQARVRAETGLGSKPRREYSAEK